MKCNCCKKENGCYQENGNKVSYYCFNCGDEEIIFNSLIVSTKLAEELIKILPNNPKIKTQTFNSELYLEIGIWVEE